jgi:demethoxyubiquinone hydroxylase (CLK1/Coq7/Cat5 family)
MTPAVRPHRAESAAAGHPLLTVYFDGACPICRREIAVYRAQPGGDRLHWLDAAAASSHELGPGLDRASALARMHVRLPDGRLVAGAGAFVEIWRALPRWRWLGHLASPAPVRALADVAYAVFLRVRPLWRAPSPSCTDTTCAVLSLIDRDATTRRDLRSDQAGETGAVRIYDGVLAVSRDPGVRAFAQRHRATELEHLALVDAWLPPARRSRLLPVWRLAGWLTGALPALAGPRAVYATIAAVETFVDRHYQDQIDRLRPLSAQDAEVARLVDLLERCRQDEVHHRDEAAASAPPPAERAWPLRLWAAMVGAGSAAAVVVCRRL